MSKPKQLRIRGRIEETGMFDPNDWEGCPNLLEAFKKNIKK